MKSSKYVLIGRYGDEVGSPDIYETKEDAQKQARAEIASCMLEDDETKADLQNEGINITDTDAIIEWGEENDLVICYEDSIAYTAGSEWSEFFVLNYNKKTDYEKLIQERLEYGV